MRPPIAQVWFLPINQENQEKLKSKNIPAQMRVVASPCVWEQKSPKTPLVHCSNDKVRLAALLAHARSTESGMGQRIEIDHNPYSTHHR